MSGGDGSGKSLMSPALRIMEVPVETRGSLGPILDQSFTGLYRWHAHRTLRSVTWVRKAARGDTHVGLSMSTMLGGSSGYIYYIAVIPSLRAKGVGALLLDDALRFLRAAGALQVFACVRAGNIPSIRLLKSRDFMRTGFRKTVHLRGFANAVELWLRMVVAPGERVFTKSYPRRGDKISVSPAPT